MVCCPKPCSPQTPCLPIPQVKHITGTKILRILKAKGLASTIPEDLYHLIKKAVAIRKHMEKNRQVSNLIWSGMHYIHPANQFKKFKVLCGFMLFKVFKNVIKSTFKKHKG